MWQIATVMTGQKQVVMFLMNSEKILSIRMLPIMRLRPSMIETQKMLTKFQRVNRPNTPRTGWKVNSLPPKKQLKTTRFMVRQRLQMNRLEKRGVLGISQLVQKQRMAKEPEIESRSPKKRYQGVQERQKASLFCQTGKLQESQKIISMLIITKIAPPISLSRQSSFLRNFLKEMKKNFNLRKEKLCDLAVNFSAIVPKSTQTEKFMEQMKCFCRFYLLSKLINFSAGLTCRCQQSTKGIKRRLVVKILQAERVRPSQLISTVIQQGTIALLIALAINSSHPKKELTSNGSQICISSSTIESPRVHLLTELEQTLDLAQLRQDLTCSLIFCS